MKYLLLQNQNIVPGTRWICRVDPDLLAPSLVAQAREFPTEMASREFSQAVNGVFIPGRNWVLLFAGVLESDRYRVPANYHEEIGEFLQGAAQWLMSEKG